MSEAFTSQNKQAQLTNTGLMCALKNRQSITIPKRIRETLSLVVGEEVTVGLTDDSTELIIRKCSGDTLDNKMIISERGAIRIPIELRRFLCLEQGDTFHIFVLKSNKAILLKKIITE